MALRLACIFLASGHSKRFGGNKLLADYNGKPMADHIFSRFPSRAMRMLQFQPRSTALPSRKTTTRQMISPKRSGSASRRSRPAPTAACFRSATSRHCPPKASKSLCGRFPPRRSVSSRWGITETAGIRSFFPPPSSRSLPPWSRINRAARSSSGTRPSWISWRPTILLNFATLTTAPTSPINKNAKSPGSKAAGAFPFRNIHFRRVEHRRLCVS